MRYRIPLATSVLVAILIFATSATNAAAGNNAGGRVYLSWDRAAYVTSHGA
jgi:hypothetical protein